MAEDQAERFADAVAALAAVADAVEPDGARASFDTTTLQVFWREWPRTGKWVGTLWRLLNEELEQPATPPSDPDLDEVGEGAGGGA